MNDCEVAEIKKLEKPEGEYDTQITLKCTREYAADIRLASDDNFGVEMINVIDAKALSDDAETLRKARAVLTEHGEMIASAREFAANYAFPANPWVCIAALADALGGEV